MKKFSIAEALKFGWNTAINHIGFFVPAMIGSFIVLLAPQFILGVVTNHNHANPIAGIFSLINFVLGVMIGLGFIKSCLKLMDGAEAGLSDFIPTSKQFWTFVSASIVCVIAVGIGLILFIIPGIILGIAFRFYPFFIVDKNMGPIESIKASYAATKGSWLDIFLLLVIDVLIVFVGAVLLGIGLFLAIPIVLMTQAYVYRKLTGTPAVATEVA
jgi:uncharacterized membrane protein